MKTRQDAHAVGCNDVEECVRETGQQSSTNASVNLHAGQWVLADEGDDERQRPAETPAETFPLAFVPCLSFVDVAARDVAKNDG